MNRAFLQTIGLLVLASATASVGCAHEAPPPPIPPVPPPIATTEISSGVAAAKPSVNVSEEILEACKIDLDNIDTAPKFDFDKSDLQPGDRGVLEKVATCVTTGPLQGRSLHLVGRADPRGEVKYNFVLGESRAGSVRAYFLEHGLDSSKLTTTSRGKLDATGTGEATWQLDRRVDLDLQ